MFTIPDKGEGVSIYQSVWWQEKIDALVEGLNGINCVLSGFNATDNGDMTFSIAKGSVMTNNVLDAVSAGTATISTADATNPRIDLIVIDSSGTLKVRTGTASSTPTPPARTANDVLLYSVWVPAGITVLTTAYIDDCRVVRDKNIVLFKTTTAETTNTTSAQIDVLNKAGGGVVIPDGLFLEGKQLHVRIGGNMLLNSGTPTVRIEIIYGGTTMFSDISGASTVDPDRNAWFVDFVLNAQANADQNLSGILAMGLLAAKTNPTTGIGDAWSTAANIAPIQGAAAVNSNAGNRTLRVAITLSVSNVANEIVTEYASIELK